MCVHREFHQYPDSRTRPPTVTRKSLCKLEIVFVFNNQEPPLSLLRVDPRRVGDDPERMGVEFFLSEEEGGSSW